MSGAIGFAFEHRVLSVLHLLQANLMKWHMKIMGEQEIRDTFGEQSLNGVDHMIQIRDLSGNESLFLLQEKWKIITNQREVSQFLDCCARILGRMPNYKGPVHRLWVSRTMPTANSEKSLEEGQVVVVQGSISQSMLAYQTAIVIAELVGRREACEGILSQLTDILPGKELVAEPVVSNFGEKRVFGFIKKTLVRVNKVTPT
jgi:hypothetical protein